MYQQPYQQEAIPTYVEPDSPGIKVDEYAEQEPPPKYIDAKNIADIYNAPPPKLREERESEKAAQKVESPKGDANFKRIFYLQVSYASMSFAV